MIYRKKIYCFRFQLHDGPEETTATIQRVQTQSWKAAVQPGFLSCQDSWDPNLLGGNIFCLVRQKRRLEDWVWTALKQTLTSCIIIKQGL